MLPKTQSPIATAMTAGMWHINMITAVPMAPLFPQGMQPAARANDSYEESSGAAAFARVSRTDNFLKAGPFGDAATIEGAEDSAAVPEALPLSGAQSLPWMPSLALISSLLLVGIFSFRGIFSRRNSEPPGASALEEIDPSERETVPLDPNEDPLMNPTGRPTVAETPRALGQRPSHGVKIGWENTPGTSIVPPPDRSFPHGGRGVK